jgi:hypothetical protein
MLAVYTLTGSTLMLAKVNTCKFIAMIKEMISIV